MRDLDMGDVMADAARMEAEYYEQIYIDLAQLDTPAVEEARYWSGINARQNDADVEYYGVANLVLMERLITTLCEGCWGRTGCDMCNPPQFSLEDMHPEYDAQTDHYEQFGRPALPNEH